jgi:NTE family protein/lysophospholipid hydrolase
MKIDETLRARVVDVLRASNVFGSLDDFVIADLANDLKIQTARGGETVLREGDPSNSMMFVIAGGLRVSRKDSTGKLLLFNEVRPGESVGEAGLILQQPRSADVVAVRDSTLAVLHKDEYEALLAKHPLALNRVFVQAIYNYLRHNNLTKKRHAESIVVVPLHNDADALEVSTGLAQAFAKMGSTHRYTLADNSKFAQVAGDQDVEEIRRQESLESDVGFLVYEAGMDAAAWTQRAFRQADQIVFVGTAGASQDISVLESQLMKEPGYAMKRRHLVVLHSPGSMYPSERGHWHRGRDVERYYPTRRGHSGDYDRLARFITGSAVGIVLGGGGARGFAHLGVLKALHESGVPIDLIGGNSMGALIGAQYACDIPLDEIRERTQKFAAGGEFPTLPLISLVSGNRVRRDLIRMFGDLQVDGLWRPYFSAACNLTKGCTTVQDSGPLWRAVLASNSPAGLFPPVLVNGELLVDGAILENVPVAAMRMRLGTEQERRRGNGTIIAVDVDVQDELSAPPDLLKLSVWKTVKNSLLPNSSKTPTIAQIMYRAGHIGGLNQRGQTIAQADIYLEPPVSSYSMMGYRSAAEIAEVGYRHTMERVSKWKR